LKGRIIYKALIVGACLVILFTSPGYAGWLKSSILKAKGIEAADPQEGIFDVESGGLGKREAVHTIAVEMIEVGIDEYEESLFDAAEKTLQRAQRYKKYLSNDELSKLNRYLKQASANAIKRKGIVDHILQADKLVKEGQLIRAKAHLKAIDDSELLTDRERKLIKEGLEKIDLWAKEQEKQIEQIYQKSIQLYSEGQLENARAGFIKVAESGLLVLPDGQTAEDYIHMIDSVSGKAAGQLAITDMELYAQKKGAEKALPGGGILGDGKPLGKPSPIKEGLGIISPKPEDTYFEAINQKRSLIQGYTNALVKDSFVKARDYINTGKYYQAQKELERIKQVLEENRLYIDDGFYTQSSAQVRQYEDEITRGREKWLGGINK
jgi:hypothetical protein